MARSSAISSGANPAPTGLEGLHSHRQVRPLGRFQPAGPFVLKCCFGSCRYRQQGAQPQAGVLPQVSSQRLGRPQHPVIIGEKRPELHLEPVPLGQLGILEKSRGGDPYPVDLQARGERNGRDASGGGQHRPGGQAQESAQCVPASLHAQLGVIGDVVHGAQQRRADPFGRSSGTYVGRVVQPFRRGSSGPHVAAVVACVFSVNHFAPSMHLPSTRPAASATTTSMRTSSRTRAEQ